MVHPLIIAIKKNKWDFENKEKQIELNKEPKTDFSGMKYKEKGNNVRMVYPRLTEGPCRNTNNYRC